MLWVLFLTVTPCLFACVSAVLQVLEVALDEYKQRHADDNTDPDEMILSAGDYLLRVLEPVQQQRTLRNYILLGAAGVGGLVTAGLLLRRLWGAAGSRDSSSSDKGISDRSSIGGVTGSSSSSSLHGAGGTAMSSEVRR